MRVTIKNEDEIRLMRQAGEILTEILEKISLRAKPGVRTKELEQMAFDLISQKGVKSAFLGYQGFPSCLCTSINEEIVHGVPSERVLKEGDLLKLDLGIVFNGFYSDKATTIGIGKISPLAKKLIKVAKLCLREGIKKAKAGNFLGDIGAAIERCAKKYGFNIIRSLAGHGIGRHLHEPPLVPNFGKEKTGLELKEGMVLCIEPMISAGSPQLKKAKDGFGFETIDRSLTAHFEETVLIKKKKAEILTRRKKRVKIF